MSGAESDTPSLLWALVDPLSGPWVRLADLVLLILPVAVLLIVAGLLFQRSSWRSLLPAVGIIVISLSLTGVVAGYAGGISRVGVMGSLVPAVLSLLGGVVVYVFGIDQSRGQIASLATCALVAGFFLGYDYGAQKRAPLDAHAQQ